MMTADEEWYTFTGREGEVIPPGVTRVRIDDSVTVIPNDAFRGNPSIEELECHDRVKTVERDAFNRCRSLRRLIMRGVRVVEGCAFCDCKALRYVECGKLERIGSSAFGCKSLRSINLPSAKIVKGYAFRNCDALTNIKFGKELESIGWGAFVACTSLECITIPLKDGMFTYDSIFQGCKKMEHVDLVEGAVLRGTIAALLLDEWRNDMKDKIGVINQILPNTPAGADFDAGGKAQAVRMWISSVLHKIVQYKAQHHSLLNEAATTLQSYLPNDIVNKNVLPFLELPTYTFEGEE